MNKMVCIDYYNLQFWVSKLKYSKKIKSEDISDLEKFLERIYRSINPPKLVGYKTYSRIKLPDLNHVVYVSNKAHTYIKTNMLSKSCVTRMINDAINMCYSIAKNEEMEVSTILKYERNKIEISYNRLDDRFVIENISEVEK